MKRLFGCGLLALVLALAPIGAAPAEGVAFDLQAFISTAVGQGQRRIVVLPGRYRVTPQQRQHLVLRNLSNLEIVAVGVEMVCTETTRALTVDNCRNLTLRGLTIDYDPLPFTQGRIVAMPPDKKRHDIELFDGYPAGDRVKPFKYEIFRPDTRTLRCPDYGYTVEKVDARHVRVVKSRGRADDPEQVGDLVVIGTETAPHGSIPHAVVTSGGSRVTYEDVTVWASNAFGFVEDGGEANVYRRCRVDRRPADDDPVRRADPRVRSLNADAFHSTRAVQGPQYLECRAQFMGDDAINIHGAYHLVMSTDGPAVRVLANGRMDIAPGDPVEVVAYDGRRLPDAKVVAVAPDGRIKPEELDFLGRQAMHQPFKRNERDCLGKAQRVTLDRAVELARGGVLASGRRCGNGFVVQGCVFGHNRSRGILIKASDGRVVNNILTECWGEAIKVSPEWWWLESGSSNNVELRGNTITDCRTVGLAVYAHGGNQQLAPSGAHNHITVADNTITGGPAPSLLVTSTDDLRLERNTCRPDPAAQLSAHYQWLFGLDPARVTPIMTLRCSQVTGGDARP